MKGNTRSFAPRWRLEEQHVDQDQGEHGAAVAGADRERHEQQQQAADQVHDAQHLLRREEAVGDRAEQHGREDRAEGPERVGDADDGAEPVGREHETERGVPGAEHDELEEHHRRQSREQAGTGSRWDEGGCGTRHRGGPFLGIFDAGLRVGWGSVQLYV
jgi:hypothetical protein